MSLLGCEGVFCCSATWLRSGTNSLKCTCDLTVSMTQGLRGEKRKQKIKYLVKYLIKCNLQKEDIKCLQVWKQRNQNYSNHMVGLMFLLVSERMCSEWTMCVSSWLRGTPSKEFREMTRLWIIGHVLALEFSQLLKTTLSGWDVNHATVSLLIRTTHATGAVADRGCF